MMNLIFGDLGSIGEYWNSGCDSGRVQAFDEHVRLFMDYEIMEMQLTLISCYKWKIASLGQQQTTNYYDGAPL